MRIEELKNVAIGKTVRETENINFGSCYPVVEENEKNNPDAKIIGVVCAKFGDYDDDKKSYWDNNNDVAWWVDEKSDEG